MVAYHDEEWGVPVRDDRLLFEFLVLEGAQAGLSWETVLRKRDEYRRVFHDFEISRVARMTGRDVERLLGNPGIIRNRAKVESAIGNARVALEVQRVEGSLSECLWSFVGGETIQNAWGSMGEVPARTQESTAMSKALKKRGMRFVGPTICYAFMQAAGLVNDHVTTCPRWKSLSRGRRR
jgi:DNA-3-methyladenine glycosylase I